MSSSPNVPIDSPRPSLWRRRLFRAVLSAFITAIVCGVGVVIWAHMHPPVEPLEKFYQTPVFSLTDQDNQNVTDQTLRGHVWICDFIFTRCLGPCPKMTQHLVGLQKELTDPNLRFVSFSVDPTDDTPAALKQYAGEMAPSEKRWMLLTGSTQAIMSTARGLKVTALPATATSPIVHDEHMLLIDANGTIRGIYDTNDGQEMQKLPRDVKTLLAEPRDTGGNTGNSVAISSH